jgi:Arc/MetJ-type ribon-helix-helix transcriptional regulator
MRLGRRFNGQTSARSTTSRDPQRVGAVLQSVARNLATQAAFTRIAAEATEPGISWIRRCAVAALGAGTATLLEDLNYFGYLFESLVVRDLRVYAQAISGRWVSRVAGGEHVDEVGVQAAVLRCCRQARQSSPEASRRRIAVRDANRYVMCMTVQLVTRIPDDLAEAIDALVRDGVFASRSEAVRAGLDSVVDRARRAAVGRSIAEGYERLPQSEDDLGWSDAASAAMIADEPW